MLWKFHARLSYFESSHWKLGRIKNFSIFVFLICFITISKFHTSHMIVRGMRYFFLWRDIIFFALFPISDLRVRMVIFSCFCIEKSIIQLIDDFKSRDYHGIIFTWWEPTLSKDLPAWIKYSLSIWMSNRIISNGMLCSNYDYTKKLADAWLELIHFSVFSLHAKVHDFLTDTPGSWDRLMKSITHALNLWIRVQINTVMNHYNQWHLDKTVKFLTKHFPPIRHFVWNNLDPLMMRKTQTAWSTLPDFGAFSPSLREAMRYLESTGRTFRAEKVPLCFIEWYEWSSTETRKKKCDWNDICTGIYEYDEYYNYIKVHPKTVSAQRKKEVVEKILSVF